MVAVLALVVNHLSKQYRVKNYWNNVKAGVLDILADKGYAPYNEIHDALRLWMRDRGHTRFIINQSLTALPSVLHRCYSFAVIGKVQVNAVKTRKRFDGSEYTDTTNSVVSIWGLTPCESAPPIPDDIWFRWVGYFTTRNMELLGDTYPHGLKRGPRIPQP